MVDSQDQFPCPACVDYSPHLLSSVSPKGFVLWDTKSGLGASVHLMLKLDYLWIESLENILWTQPLHRIFPHLPPTFHWFMFPPLGAQWSEDWKCFPFFISWGSSHYHWENNHTLCLSPNLKNISLFKPKWHHFSELGYSLVLLWMSSDQEFHVLALELELWFCVSFRQKKDLNLPDLQECLPTDPLNERMSLSVSCSRPYL